MSKLTLLQMMADLDDHCGEQCEPVHPGDAQAAGPDHNNTETLPDSQAEKLSAQDIEAMLEKARADIGTFLQKYKIPHTVKNKDDCILYELEQCPGNPEHKQSAFLLYPKADPYFKCFHDSCAESNFPRAVIKLATGNDDDIQTLELEPKLVALNRTHAVVNLNGRFAILRSGKDPITNYTMTYFSSVGDFNNFQKNNLALVPDGKRKKIGQTSEWWLKSAKRREYKGVIFEPSRQVPGYYNLYQGFAVEPKPGDCSLFIDHIVNVIASGDKEIALYILSWMAHIIQHPGDQRPGTALALGGIQGCGKGIFVYYFGKIIGAHFLHLSGSEQLTGRFNEHLNAKLLVFADEAVWAGDKTAEGKLKAMITEPTLFIEPKGLNGFAISNHMRLILASNNDWIVPAGLEERRFLVLKVSPERAGDFEYFANIEKQMSNGGLEALLHYLLHFDLSQVNLRKIPRTRALFEQMISSMTSFEKFWLDRLTSGCMFEMAINKLLTSNAPLLDRYIEPWPSEVLVSDLFIEFTLFCREMNVRYRSSSTQLGKHLAQICPEVVRKRYSTGPRDYYYLVPSLEVCRKAFEERVKMPINWS